MLDTIGGSRGAGVAVCLLMPAVLCLLATVAVRNAVAQPAAGGPQQARGQMANGIMPYALGGGGAAVGLGLSWYLLRRHLRSRLRRCPACRIDMVRLGEAADGAHVTSGQRVKNPTRSVDYDVWTCPTCPHVDKIRSTALFTTSARCPKCSSLTRSTTVSRRKSPTSWSSGLEEIREGCRRCDYTLRSIRVVPRLDTSDSSFWSSSSLSNG